MDSSEKHAKRIFDATCAHDTRLRTNDCEQCIAAEIRAAIAEAEAPLRAALSLVVALGECHPCTDGCLHGDVRGVVFGMPIPCPVAAARKAFGGGS